MDLHQPGNVMVSDTHRNKPPRAAKAPQNKQHTLDVSSSSTVKGPRSTRPELVTNSTPSSCPNSDFATSPALSMARLVNHKVDLPC